MPFTAQTATRWKEVGKRERRLQELNERLERSQNGGLTLAESKHLFSASCVVASILLAALLIIFCPKVHADEIPEERAIAAIIGEAENQDLYGMEAVACAIRNRGTLKGVYGEHAPRVRHHLYSAEIYKLAKVAWMLSKDEDITGGATHWENVKAFGLPCWAKSCTETFRYKDHIFYRVTKRKIKGDHHGV